MIVSLKAGQQLAFEKIYAQYSERLLGYILKLVKLEEVAVDVLQEVFVKVWVHRASIDENLSFKSYIFRITENVVYDYYRRMSRDKELQAKLILAASANYRHVEEEMISKEEKLLLHNIIEELPPTRRQVFKLQKFAGKSYKEIGEELNISTSTVSDHVQKANKYVQQRLHASKGIHLLLLLSACRFFS